MNSVSRSTEVLTPPEIATMMSNRIAVEFVRHVLQSNPHADNFGDIYDAMSRAACSRSFYNLGHEELAQAGVSFSLLAINNLERLVTDVQHSMQKDN